jgi:hypothetical protein
MLESGEGRDLMNDLPKWKIQGPVRTLRSESSEWDLSSEEWRTPQGFTLVQFLSNGRIAETEHHNPDGSICRSIYSYDAAGRFSELRFAMSGGPVSRTSYLYDEFGRRTRVYHIDKDGNEHESEGWRYEHDGRKTKTYSVPKLEPNTDFVYTIEGTEQSYSATGTAIIVTEYDQADRPIEVLFQDAEQRLLRRVTFERDSAGRLVKEELHLTGPNPLADVQKELENVPPAVRETAASSIEILFGPVLSRTTYAYDREGHLQERLMLMGALAESRTTFRYDDYGNPIDQVTEDSSREMQIDEEGNIRPVKQNSSKHHIHFAYTYASPGNWVERVVWNRLEPNPNFQRSNVERREITYYEV